MGLTLREARRRAVRREEAVHKRVVQDRVTIRHIEAELAEEREVRSNLRDKRQDLREEIEQELAADRHGGGIHGEGWEQRREDRLDELGDLWELSETRIQRLLRRALEEGGELERHMRAEDRWEKRIRIIERKLEDRRNNIGQLTKDIYVWEFDCHDGTRVVDFCPYMIPHLEVWAKQHGQPLRDHYGAALTINSGLRPAAYNASIGGATQSYHIYELRKESPAGDHIIAGIAAASVQQWHENNNPFDGMGFYAGFTHGDDRGYRSRWYGAA